MRPVTQLRPTGVRRSLAEPTSGLVASLLAVGPRCYSPDARRYVPHHGLELLGHRLKVCGEPDACGIGAILLSLRRKFALVVNLPIATNQHKRRSCHSEKASNKRLIYQPFAEAAVKPPAIITHTRSPAPRHARAPKSALSFPSICYWIKIRNCLVKASVGPR